MRKLGKLIESAPTDSGVEYQKLLTAYQRAKQNVQLGRDKRREKTKALQAASADKKASGSAVFALFIEAEKARLEQKMRRADFKLAKFNLKNWFAQQQKAEKKSAKEAEKIARTTGEKAQKETAKKPQKAAPKRASKSAAPAAKVFVKTAKKSTSTTS